MNLKEYASLNDITLADAKKRTGLTHWKQEVVEAVVSSVIESPFADDEQEDIIEEAAEEVIEVVEEAVKEVAKVVVKAAVDLVSEEDKVRSVRGLGTKSPYWRELNG